VPPPSPPQRSVTGGGLGYLNLRRVSSTLASFRWGSAARGTW